MQQALLLPPGGQGPPGLKAVLRERPHEEMWCSPCGYSGQHPDSRRGCGVAKNQGHSHKQ